jgi:FkbM family methyltransferase
MSRFAGLLDRVPRTVRLQPLHLRLQSLSLAGMNLDGAGSDTQASGEQVTLLYLARHLRLTEPIVFDVGAHAGAYSLCALDIIGDRMTLHAFEPSAAAFARLSTNVGHRRGVQLHQKALDESAGHASLFADRPGSDVANLFTSAHDYWEQASEIQPQEAVEVARLDDVCRELGVSRLSLLKLDAEGRELGALRGGATLIRDRAIDLIQFEFGVAAMGPRGFFCDLYELLNPHYRVYRILQNGLAPIDRYDPVRCEVFSTSSNYLAVSRDLEVPLAHELVPRLAETQGGDRDSVHNPAAHVN